MVTHFGYCPSLRKKVDFEVSEVIDLQTKRGTKYQVKGFYEGRLCNTFCSAETAAELRNSVGTPKNFAMMSEESQENLGQATQEENVPAIVGPSEMAYGQEGEAAEALPLAETVPTPIIDADGIGIEPIDNLSLPDATVEDMQITYDEAPQMDANFEIAEMQPEGDGSSIGNIAPMNPDAPLHAEEFESEESQANLGQATQEENVPAIVGPSEMAYGQEGEAAEALPLAETVPTPIIDADGIGIEPIDNLNLDLNGGDILSAMQIQFGEAPEMLADFSIAPMQPEGDGSSIGNIAPMNPDAPLHAEEFEADDYSSISFEETIAMEEVPPAVCFVEKIPPEVWANTSLEDKVLYEKTGDESVLDCPVCGMTKSDMRALDGYCPTTDPEGQDYISTNSCPYEKYFAPQHWIEEPKVIGHISEHGIELEDTLPPNVDMPPIDPLESGVIITTIPTFHYNKIYAQLPSGVMARQDPLGFNYELSYYGMDEPKVQELIDLAEGSYDFMYASEQYSGEVVSTHNGFELKAESIVPYSAESKKALSGKTAEKAILTGASTGATMEVADALLAAEEFGAESSDWAEIKEEINDYGVGVMVYFIPKKPQTHSEMRSMIKEYFGITGSFPSQSHFHFITNDGYDIIPTTENDEGVIEPVFHIRKQDNERSWGAEEFNVEFDDWAEQEMLTHGENVSFKEWAKEEGKKHGDVDLEDWAEHEEESHDERYGAEDDTWLYYNIDRGVYRLPIIDNQLRGRMEDREYEMRTGFPNAHELLSNAKEASSKSAKLNALYEWVRGDDGRVVRVFRPNLGLEAETFDAEWNLDVVGGKGLTTDNIIVRRNDVAKGRLAVYPKGHESVQVDVYEPEGSHIDSHFFEAPETKMKPPVKTLGILLGVGALVAILAPQNLRDMFKK